MTIINFPPPRRFVVEVDSGDANDYDIADPPKLKEVTGEADPVYIVGIEDPWLGAPIEDIERWTLEGHYGTDTWQLLNQIERVKEGGSCTS